MTKSRFKTKIGKWDRDSVVDYICEHLESSSCGMQAILDNCDEDMPNQFSIYRWLNKFDDLSEKYAQAKQKQMDYLAEELLLIADDSINDYTIKGGADGEEQIVLNAEHVQRSRLRIDARKWLMSKLKPKKYGDKLHTELSGDIGVSDLSSLSDDELKQRRKQLENG